MRQDQSFYFAVAAIFGTILLDFLGSEMATLPPPTPAQLADNQGPGIIAANLTVVIIATIAVFVRLLVRRSQKAGLGPDDYVVVAALVPFSSILLQW